ncbi:MULTISPECIES: hypothetical protein [Sporosarcina]|uniref:Uncharacterized protein n=1 Tax=Sporosarcina newyorkensis TaxID=759851 RepID=A0A1T4YH71_9BACL|nr:hypothetical protein [Sporosarcina newyorkensis]SKB01177.1 hypothetical protein SAMN04244570_2611 [Sporosarcina newyorkensis]
MLPSSSGLLGFLMGFGTVLAIAVYLRRKGKNNVSLMNAMKKSMLKLERFLGG